MPPPPVPPSHAKLPPTLQPAPPGGTARVLRRVGKILLWLFIAFVCFLGFRIYQLVQYSKAHPRAVTPAEAALKAAEKAIMSSRRNVENGNTAEARALAQEISETMLELRNTFFTKREDEGSGVSLSGGKFLTHCTIEGDRCAVLLHAPDIRHFTQEAQESMVDFAWATAFSAIAKRGFAATNLAVGVKGVMLYTGMRAGTVCPEKDAMDCIGTSVNNGVGVSDMLEPYYDQSVRLPPQVPAPKLLKRGGSDAEAVEPEPSGT